MRTTEKLIEHFGDEEKTIAALDINPETWRLWKRDGVPPKRWLFVEEKTGGTVTAEQMVAEAREAA